MGVSLPAAITGLALTALLACAPVRAAPPGSEVKSLPGWEGKLPSRWFSGTADAGDPPGKEAKSMKTHYVFVESERDPANDPVVVWYQGGPGASSMFGLLVELGPLLLNQESLDNDAFRQTGVPQLVRNPSAWSKVANVLVVDNPPPIGFSYCEPAGPTAAGTSCGPWNDSTVAASNKIFLENWVKLFPEYASNPMYITGESYAGIYVPTIAHRIWKDEASPIHLAGVAIGDGCMGTDVLCGHHEGGPWWDLEFMHGHGQMGEKPYRAMLAVCAEADLKSGQLTKQCQEQVDSLQSSLGGYYGYSLYDECYAERIFQTSGKAARRSWWGPPSGKAPRLGGALNDYACPGDAMNLWLNRTDVRVALGVDPKANFFSGDNGVGFNYTLTEENILPLLMDFMADPGMRVVVYNGDTDPGINSMVTQDKYFTYFDAHGVKETQAWRPWTQDGQQRMGGYAVEYAGNFTYLTIRGSGHMVPEYKPAASLSFLAHLLNGTDLPRYVKPSRGM